MEAAALQFLNGIGVGLIYFLLAVGLTIIFGILNFVNFAHGAFYLLGAYATYGYVSLTGDFWGALIAAPVLVGLVAWLTNDILLGRLYHMAHIYHIIVTFGLALVAQELMVVIWGPVPRNVSIPSALQGVLNIGPFFYSQYRLFVITLTGFLIVTLWLLLERTKIGAIVRAGAESTEMVSCLGIHIFRVFRGVFVLGASLAALAGVMAAPMRGVYPFMGDEVLGIAFVVVVLGGMGSFVGALLAALLVGVVQNMTVLVWPAGAHVMIYLTMALVLLIRSGGLMGRSIDAV